MVEGLAERVELGLHGATRVSRQLARQAFGRGVRAVRRGECVVDIDVAELCKLIDEGRIVLLFLFMEARVFEKQHVAVLHRGDGFVRSCANAIVRECHMPLEDVRELRGDGLE